MCVPVHRGLIPTVVLSRLEELCGMKTYRMFDYVCGTSTGAILLGLLCLKRSDIAEIQQIYRELSTKVFKMNNLLGISQLFLNHAFYDAKMLEKVIRYAQYSGLGRGSAIPHTCHTHSCTV